MKRSRKIAVANIALIIGYVVTNLWMSSNFLTVNEYKFVTDKVTQEITMVVLSDLHEHEFGDGNDDLVKKIYAQKPDLILLGGDILNNDSKNSDIPCELIQKLSESAPVYYALGNHEIAYMDNGHSELIQQLKNVGAVVLERKYVDLEIDGISLRLGGLYDYAFGLNSDDIDDEKVRMFLENFQDTEVLKVMVAHRPDSFVFGDAASVWNIDLVVSGHNHGGQIVIPFFGGLYGGDQGWFPQYIHGMYQKENIEIFVTSGLGSNGQVLKRFNNLPEIAVLRIIPK